MLRTLSSAWRLPPPRTIGRDQVTAAVRALPAAALGALVNAVIVAVTLWNVVPHLELVGWFTCTAGISGSQLFHRPAGRPATNAPLSPRTIRRSMMKSAAAALPWSLLVVLFLGRLPHSSELILIAIGAGMAASGSVFLAPIYPAALTYMAVILVPAALKSFLLTSSGYGPLGFLSLSYAAFLYAVIATKAQLLVERSQSSALLQQRDELISAQNERLDTALENMSQGLVMYDAEWRIVVANSRFAEIYDLTPDQVTPGTTLREVLQRRMDKGHYPGKLLDQVLAAVLARVEGDLWRQYVNELPDGRFVAVTSRPMGNGGYVVTLEDVTKQRRIEAKIAHMATHDALTDLANRNLFRDHLDKAAAAVRQGDRGVALLAVDLNKFKQVNDTLGHPAGDALLQAVAHRLTKCVRDEDCIARLGGDEFAVVLHARHPAEDAHLLASRILLALNAPYPLVDTWVEVGASIGIAVAHDASADTERLIREADIALYRAKADGGSRCRFFEPDMDRRSQRVA